MPNMIPESADGINSSRRGKRGWRALGLATVMLAVAAAAWGFWIGGPRSDGPKSPGGPLKNPEDGAIAPRFRDMTADAGLHFTCRNGAEADLFTILEMLGSGVGLLDYDGDGLLDVFVAGGGYFGAPDKKTIQGHPCKLFRNLGHWKFRDVTREVGLNVAWWYTQGVAVADYDRDGWPDLLVTGYGRVGLFHNEPDGKGGRRFVDQTAQIGLLDDLWSTSAGWADVDGDGYPDLYLCHYVDWSFANDPVCPAVVPEADRDVCAPQVFKPLVHALFRNEMGKRFRNVSAEHGFKAEGRGLGVVLLDINNDRRPDIYVANDAGDNFLFVNRDGKLNETALKSGVAVDDNGHYNGSMGIDAGDFDGTGRPALWVTNYQGELHALYVNLGREIFQHRSRATGLGAIGVHFVGFGTGFLDFDNDGWEDLVIANGHVLRYPGRGSTVKQRPVLLHNVEQRGQRFFKDVGAKAGAYFQTPTVARGLAIGDLDNDGAPDLVVTNMNSPVNLLRNEAAAAPNRWLGVQLVGRDHRDIVGSTIVLETNERKLTRFAKGGGSYLSASDSRILFGLGPTNQPRRLTVQWSWGETQTWDDLQPNSYWQLQEGKAEAKRLPPAPR